MISINNIPIHSKIMDNTSDPLAELHEVAVSFHKIMAELEAYLAKIDGGGKPDPAYLQKLLAGMHQCANVLRSLIGEIQKTNPTLYNECVAFLGNCEDITLNISSGDMGSQDTLNMCTQAANLLTKIINNT